jgi:sulfatase modifying factor 1
MLHLLSKLSTAFALATISISTASAGMVTFGVEANTFSIQFQEIGSPGNIADNTGIPNPAGSVPYIYSIGIYEIKRDSITKYNANYGVANNLEITMHDMTSGGGSNGPNKPATGVSWNEAARFVNWLNTSTGFTEAYKFTTNGIQDDIEPWSTNDSGYNASNPYRNQFAKYFLPTVDEWYKAAFFDPTANVYFDFANGSNTAPIAISSGSSPNTVVYGQYAIFGGPADVDMAGGQSPFGVVALTGNVWDMLETEIDLTNDNPSERRQVRGGTWQATPGYINNEWVGSVLPFEEGGATGFRVVSISSVSTVPEPGLASFLFGCGIIASVRRLRQSKLKR